MNESNENFYLTTAPIRKLLIKFSIPCVLAMLVSALYNIVDQIFIGNSSAGTAGIMATTLVFPFTVVALANDLFITCFIGTKWNLASSSYSRNIVFNSKLDIYNEK